MLAAETANSWFDFGMSYTSGSIAWRLPIAFQIIFAVIVIVVLFGLPESPRWLFAQGRREDAIKALCLVHEEDEDGPEVTYATRQIQGALDYEDKNGAFKWRQILKADDIHTGKRVLLAWGVQVRPD